MTPDPTCTAHRHGTRSAYNAAGCRCPEARQAAARYQALRVRRQILGQPAPRKPVPGLATRRRLQALAAIGWDNTAIGNLVGVDHSAVAQWGRTALVKPDTERRVHELYDRLWRTPGPSEQARRIAARKGYLPPLWWDDDRIGDPDYDPRQDVVPLAQLRTERKRERMAEVLRLHRSGLSLAQIAARLDVRPRQVSRDLADLRAEGAVDAQELDELARQEALEHDDECCEPDDLESVAS